jgi:hypothetical protein
VAELLFLCGTSDGCIVSPGMRSLLAWLLLLCAVGAVGQQTQPSPLSTSHRVKHQEPANSNKDDTGGLASPSPDNRNGNIVTFVDQNCSEQDADRGKQSGYWNKVISPEILPIWIASFVAVVGTIIAVRTLKAIKREAKEIQDVAKAASLNAQAVINAERPWLVVATFFEKDRPELCRFGCRNQGNTPAKIVSVSAQIGFVDRPDHLHVPPDYSSFVAMPDLTLIVHTDSFPIGVGVNPRSVIQSANHEALVLSAREFLVYFGNVVYRDTLYPESSMEGLHETRWCFVYQPGGDKMFLRSGPAEYNRYT